MWIWERLQWRGTQHCPKLQYYWSLAIRLFSAISTSDCFEFESHWVPFSYGLVPHLSKKLSKFPTSDCLVSYYIVRGGVLLLCRNAESVYYRRRKWSWWIEFKFETQVKYAMRINAGRIFGYFSIKKCLSWLSLVSLFNGISSLAGYLM